MRTHPIVGVGVIAATVLMAVAACAEPQAMAPGCAKIVALLDESGGRRSPDEIAKATDTDIETVRSCTDAWRASMKDPKAPAGTAASKPMPAGCAKIVAVLDEGGGLSPDQIAQKTSTDIDTVRSCTDAWRQGMKGGAHP
jgi:hypothetical protein